MVHPALLRTVANPGRPAASRSPADGPGWWLPGFAKRLIRRWDRSAAAGYRPELHYMRGGRTTGAKSLAAG